MPPKTQAKKMCAKKNCTSLNCPFPHPKPYEPTESALQPVKKIVSHGGATYSPRASVFLYKNLPRVIPTGTAKPSAHKCEELLRDEIRSCKNCRQDFLLTIKESEWFLNKGFTFPKRCKECREVRRKNGDVAGCSVVISTEIGTQEKSTQDIIQEDEMSYDEAI